MVRTGGNEGTDGTKHNGSTEPQELMNYFSVSGTNGKSFNVNGKILLKRGIKVSHYNLRLLILQLPLASILGTVSENMYALTHPTDRVKHTRLWYYR